MTDYAELLRRFQPQLKYDSNEAFFADAASAWTENPGNVLRRTLVDGTPGEVIAYATPEPGQTQLSLDFLGEPTYADGRPAESGDVISSPHRNYREMYVAVWTRGGHANRMYGRAQEDSEGRLWLQYWFYYFYKDPNFAGRGGQHEGDWEMVQLRMGPGGDEPDLAVYAQHAHAEKAPWDEVEREPGRPDTPRVYVARGSHASYFHAGYHETEAWYDMADGLRRAPRLELEIIGEDIPGWLRWPGRWGDTRPRVPGVEQPSPRGPCAHEQWDDPRKLLERARPHARPAALRPPEVRVTRRRGRLVVEFDFSARVAPRPERLVITVSSVDDRLPPRTYTFAVEPVLRGTIETEIELREQQRYDVYASTTDAEGRPSESRLVLLDPVSLSRPWYLSIFPPIGWLADRYSAALRLAFGRLKADPDAVFDGALRESIERPEIDELARAAGLDVHELEEEARADRATIEQAVLTEAATLFQAERTRRRARMSARLSLLTSVVALTGVIAVIGFVLSLELAWWVPVVMAVVALAAGPISVQAQTLAAPGIYAAAAAAYQQALDERGVLPFLRERINRELSTDYSLNLRFDLTKGLSELADESVEVPTAATEELQRLVAEMPGGSIGIAGPRGAGKSTLIRAFCKGRFREPGGLALWVSAPVDYRPRDFVLHLYGALCRTIVGPERPPTAFRLALWRRMTIATAAYLAMAGGVLLWIYDDSVPDVTGVQLAGGALAVAGALAALALVVPIYFSLLMGQQRTAAPAGLPFAVIRDARLRLEKIRFLQSLSSGWKGELKLPIGGAGLEGGRTLTEQQATLPDLVDEFREFATTVAQEAGRLIIGIDELDKIHGTEDAQRFINDIKGVFGVPRCFFLISISEDALANFDRRGVPVRDAFDSSLDDVVRVGYLPLAGTRRLLHRRVVGLNEAFVCLCHCLAAGLPRDVIRLARNIVREHEKATVPRSLRVVTQSVAAQDFEVKKQATITAANSLGPLPEVGALLAWLHPQKLVEDPEQLEQLTFADVQGRPDLELATFRALAQLATEFASFSYVLMTAVQVFSQLDERKLQGVLGSEAPNLFDRLAKARQALAVHPQLAWDETTTFRRAWPIEGDVPALVELMPAPPPDASSSPELAGVSTTGD